MKRLRDGGSNQRALAGGLSLRQSAALAASALLSLVGLLFAEMTVDAAAEDAVAGLVLSSDDPAVLAISWDAHDPPPTDYRVNWSKTGEDFPPSVRTTATAYPTTLDTFVRVLNHAVTRSSLDRKSARARFPLQSALCRRGSAVPPQSSCDSEFSGRRSYRPALRPWSSRPVMSSGAARLPFIGETQQAIQQ